MLEELTEESTTEQVNEYVEQVVEEVKAERAGTEKKSDAQITAEHSQPAKETPLAEKKSGDVEEPARKEPSSAKWLDDDLKAEMSAYGIQESELADFANREELDRALRLFDKSALEAGKKAIQEETGRNEKGQFLKKEQEPEKQAEKKSGRHEIALSKDVYDEEIVAEFTRLRDHYEDRLAALESRFMEADAQAEEHRFDTAIDKLDMPKLFGATGSETPDELKKRSEVLSQARVLQAGFRTFGREVSIDKLVGRAAAMVFASEFDKQKLKNHTRKISRQSNTRQGGGATRPQDPREDPRDEADRLYKELSRTS